MVVMIKILMNHNVKRVVPMLCNNDERSLAAAHCGILILYMGPRAANKTLSEYISFILMTVGFNCGCAKAPRSA